MNDNTNIADFYRRYPYPKVDKVEFDLNTLDQYFYLSHACFDHSYPRRSGRAGRMLVAGCGTREAVSWALSCPKWQIDAVDISERAIEISKHLAKQVDVGDRIRFTLGNFEAGDGLEGPYDFVNCVGVLHHLSDPQQGLRQLEGHLAPGGIMALMVYSHSNRRDIQNAQRVIELLTKDLDAKDHIESEALAICRMGSETTNRLKPTFESAVERYEENHPQFADTMLNPREVSYSIPQLVELLSAAGLQLVSPVLPILWDAQDCLPARACEQYQRLEMLERLEVGDKLRGPLFWVLAKRAAPSVPTRPCLSDDELFWDLVPMPKALRLYKVEALQVAARAEPWEIPTKMVGKDGVRIHRYDAWTSFHRIAKDMLDLIDGHRSFLEIGQIVASMYQVPFASIKDTTLRYFHRLIDEMTLATIDTTKCHRCPLRNAAKAGKAA